MKRFSHSSVDLYSLCGRKFKLQKIEKWRSPKLSSPLFFGRALDEAFSVLLCDKKVVLTDKELNVKLSKSAEEVFEDNMIIGEDVNRDPIELSHSLLADYYVSDFSPELMQKKHLKQLQVFEPTYSLSAFLDFHEQCKEQLRAKEILNEGDRLLFNYLSWVSLVEKGKLMIDSYRQVVIPQISEVVDIQKPISIKNEDGDEITGYIDFTAKFVGDDSIYICDNKSSSKAYTPGSVKESFQLATYCEAEGTNKAAYVVSEKKIFKKDSDTIVNGIRSSIIKDVIPEEQFQATFDRFENTAYNVQQGLFPENRSSCFSFGRICEYYKVCNFNDYSGLIRLGKKDEGTL
jgi:hypothetical protein